MSVDEKIHTRSTDFITSEDKEAGRFRRVMKMRPLIREKKNCLRCDREFMSVDKIKNRICPTCKGTIRNAIQEGEHIGI